MAHLALALLGPLHITLDARPVTGFDYDKVRALLAYLAVEADRAHRRAALAGLLWPDQSEQAAHNSLRQALATLRRAIGDQAAAAPFLHITRDAIQFNQASDHDLDVAAFTALLAACERHLHRHPETCPSCARRLQEAVALYRGDFLAQFYLPDSVTFEEWALLKREQLHRLMLQALIQLANYYEWHSDYAQTQRYASRQLEFEPWREEAHRQLMRVFVLSGQRSAALAQYETCCRILVRDLRVEPEAESTALYEQIRDGELRIENEELKNTHIERFSIFNSQFSISRHNFPAQTTPLIGRETDLAELGALLENPACRLITIVGPGGMGKTRLALAAATEQAPTWTNGAAFVPLAAVSSATFLASAILTALDVALQGQREPRDQLLEYLREKELLILLDNFEQLLAPDLREDESGAVLLTDILQRAPRVTLLVTSRERLALAGEWVFDLAGLSYPLGDPIDGVESYNSMQLFVQRAGQVRRQFALVDSDARAVARICRLVEGLPLAIELAAAGLRTRSCAAIADAIERSLSALATGLRAIPERHRSVWATFEHSWRLLSDEERQVFPRLSVFRGGFEEDAAAQVAQATPQLLAMLVDKSLLRWDGAARYDMHELVRQYTSAKLDEAGEAEAIQRQHAAYYLAVAETARLAIEESEQAAWLRRLEIEHDNLRAALQWALGQNAAELGARISGSLWKFWEIRGYLSEGRRWLERILVESEAISVAARATALHGAANLASAQGDNVQALALGAEALALFRALGDSSGSAWVLTYMGFASRQRGDDMQATAQFTEGLSLFRNLGYTGGIAVCLEGLGRIAQSQEQLEHAETLVAESLALRRDLGNKIDIAWVLNALGGVAVDQGKFGQATALFEESLTLFRELGHKRGISGELNHLGQVALLQSNFEQAAVLIEEGLALARSVGDKSGIAFALNLLGRLASMQGDHDRATLLQKESMAIGREMGNPWDNAIGLYHLGHVTLSRGDWARAAALFAESLAIYRDLGKANFLACSLTGFAGVAGAQGQPERAAKLLGAAHQLLAATGARLHPFDLQDLDRTLSSVRSQLDEAIFATAWAAGQALTLEQAVAYTLEVGTADTLAPVSVASWTQ